MFDGQVTVRLNGVDLKTRGAELKLGGSIVEPVQFEFAMDVHRGVETVSRTVDRERARREMDELREQLRANMHRWEERGWLAPQRG